mmetsp:Transcript_10643/g.13217  ORF Transcript_10643/g.13217 Transcript_10643/m.13217 type:complete len:224 (+) Transcript_10643:1-672(+)
MDSTRPTVVAQLVKTKMCIQFSRGHCASAACRFAHSAEELRPAPDLLKTAMCRAFARGSCTAAACRFAHSDAELRVSPSVYKTQLCNFFARGHCKKGDRCRHAHGWKELRNQDSEKSPKGLFQVPPGLASENFENFTTPKKVKANNPESVSPSGLTPSPTSPVKVSMRTAESLCTFSTSLSTALAAASKQALLGELTRRKDLAGGREGAEGVASRSSGKTRVL